MDETTIPVASEAPRGFYSASVDDKGRLKLPVAFQNFLNGTGDQMFFVTSTDGRIARIYPISLWKANENLIEDLAQKNPDAAASVSFMAQHYGAEAKMDKDGRMMLPTDLRRELRLEKEVRLGSYLGGVNIYSQEEYQAHLAQAKADLTAHLRSARTEGFR